MKKMIVALVAMFVMTMSASAQSDINSVKFDRISSYLELTVNQVEPVKTAMAQLNSSMEALYQLEDQSKGLEAWEKIHNRHMTTMKKILSEKQFNKYEQMFELTARNTAERLTNKDRASR